MLLLLTGCPCCLHFFLRIWYFQLLLLLAAVNGFKYCWLQSDCSRYILNFGLFKMCMHILKLTNHNIDRSVSFCRVVLTTSSEWGVMVTKLTVPADWKGLSFSFFVFHIHTFCISDLNLILNPSFHVQCRMADLLATPGTISGFSCVILHILSEIWFVLELPWTWQKD